MRTTTPTPGWRTLEAAAPELADTGRGLIERVRVLHAGTIRRDGTPRITPVEAHLVQGHLVLAMIPGTPKARDLLRDPRVLLHSHVAHPGDRNEELKLRGAAIEVAERALLDAASDAIEAASGWRPGQGWHVFSIDLDSAALVAWDRGEGRLTLWTRERGVEERRLSVPA